MPPPYVTTIREGILYEYAKLISRSARETPRGTLVRDRFQELCHGQITISGTIREWEQDQALPRECIYCGSTEDLTTTYLVARRRGGERSAENAVLVCQSCHTAKGNKGVYEWLGLEKADALPRLVAGRYLNQLYTLHERAGTLDFTKDNIERLCAHCSIPHLCVNWGKSQALTRYCLESILPQEWCRPVGKPSEDMLGLIGSTPMVKLKRLSKDIPAQIWAKLEFFNPSGSVKDRIALRMIEEAEQRGRLTKGAVIVEATSGNTGIGLALVCALKGYRMIAVMPEAMSRERRMIMELLGAKVEIVPSRGECQRGFTKEDIEATLARAIEIVQQTPNAFLPNQFENPDNPKEHAESTALEIIEQTAGEFDAFVAACGTGGTFSGVAGVLKEYYPEIRRVVVEPAGSPVLSGGNPGYHNIQGIGEGFIPGVMDTSLADEVIQVSDDDAVAMMKRLAREEGILGGISAGANVFASLQIGKKMKEKQIIVTIIPDHVFRYCSTNLLS